MHDGSPPSPRKGKSELDNTEVSRRFLLKREIGRGGMCVVYAAEHRYTRRNVAIKLLSDSASGKRDLCARLLREAAALGRLRHENILQALDAGVDNEGSPYLVLELVDGRTLDDILTVRGHLSPGEAVTIVRGVASALGAAHRRGIIHRDVKPGNVFVANGPDGETVKLGDFGLAYVPNDHESAPRLTGQGVIIGTPEYMGPEQLMSQPVSLQFDIWALGVLLHELLTGEVPFVGNYHDVLLQTMASNKPAVAGPSPLIPESLVPVINRSLSRTPEVRYQNVDDFLAALDACPVKPQKLSLLAGNIQRANNEAAKRAQVRVPYRAPARVDLEGGKRLEGRCDNISLGGVLMHLSEDLAVGTPVHICFALPASGLVTTLPTTVRWVKRLDGVGHLKYAIGFEFHYLDKKSEDEIRAYVEYVGENHV